MTWLQSLKMIVAMTKKEKKEEALRLKAAIDAKKKPIGWQPSQRRSLAAILAYFLTAFNRSVNVDHFFSCCRHDFLAVLGR